MSLHTSLSNMRTKNIFLAWDAIKSLFIPVYGTNRKILFPSLVVRGRSFFFFAPVAIIYSVFTKIMALIIHTLISNILKNPQCNFYTYVKHFLIWNIFIKSSAPLLTLILRLTLLWKHTDIYTKIINSNFQYVKHQKHFSVTYFSVFTLLVKKKNLSLRLDFHSSYWNAGFLVNFSSNRLNTRE